MTRHDHVDREVGARIRERRATLDLSQRDLADGICSYALISRFEKGNRIPTPGTLAALARRLGVDASWLGTGQHDPAVDLEHALGLLAELEAALGHPGEAGLARDARELVDGYLTKIGWTRSEDRAMCVNVKTDDAGETGR